MEDNQFLNKKRGNDLLQNLIIQNDNSQKKEKGEQNNKKKKSKLSDKEIKGVMDEIELNDKKKKIFIINKNSVYQRFTIETDFINCYLMDLSEKTIYSLFLKFEDFSQISIHQIKNKEDIYTIKNPQYMEFKKKDILSITLTNNTLTLFQPFQTIIKEIILNENDLKYIIIVMNKGSLTFF